jgi:hypothetical protein
VKLGERHGARLEPAIEDFGNSSENSLALLRGNGNVIDAFSVEISNFSTSRELLEFLN